MSSTKSEKKPASSKLAAYRAKRLAKLNAIRQEDETKFLCQVNLKEAKQLQIIDSWKAFCDMKAKAFADYWTKCGEKDGKIGGEKAKAKKVARLGKLKVMLEALEKELA